jgi:hypothetical protein
MAARGATWSAVRGPPGVAGLPPSVRVDVRAVLPVRQRTLVVKGLEFYGAAAQVIPVLALILLVEVRLSPLGQHFYASYLIPVVLLTSYAAEVGCLLVLKYERDPRDIVFVLTSIAGGSIAGCVTAWAGLYVSAARALHKDDPPPDNG